MINIQISGAKAVDDKDGDISDKIIITGKVDTTKEGTYTITYTVQDFAKNETIVKRTVIVKNKKTEQEPDVQPDSDSNSKPEEIIPEQKPEPKPEPGLEENQNNISNNNMSNNNIAN